MGRFPFAEGPPPAAPEVEVGGLKMALRAAAAVEVVGGFRAEEEEDDVE